MNHLSFGKVDEMTHIKFGNICCEREEIDRWIDR
jgi:hypothetical protein